MSARVVFQKMRRDAGGGSGDEGKEAMKNIDLVPVGYEDLSNFKMEMQYAVQYGYEKEYGHCDRLVLPEADIDQSLFAEGAAAYAVYLDGKMIGGAVVNIDERTQHNHLDLLFVKVGCQSRGLGLAIWRAIEEKYPETRVWETFTPYFERRNIHFYVNLCGFHIVEFYNPRHRDPHTGGEAVGGMCNEAGSYFFRFEKVVQN